MAPKKVSFVIRNFYFNKLKYIPSLHVSPLYPAAHAGHLPLTLSHIVSFLQFPHDDSQFLP